MARHAAPSPYALDPRLAADSHPLHALPLGDLRLMDDANYPWLVLVPRVADARELIDLDAAQRQQVTTEIDLGLRLLRAHLLAQRGAARQSVGHFPKSHLDGLFILRHGHGALDLRDVQPRLVAPGVKNGKQRLGR